ncbi:hypothetical protein Pmani_022914 [Petrolisthes manimaculis]|uniref:Uncharacterized protein n=1 Tax=Petrolisthes manimaculis TaxID=1843537 RepID=A0AAE1U1M9_9EUCA|nr:hypothetical protein Pmani_022914 [Petrolisthes manimaculis]
MDRGGCNAHFECPPASPTNTSSSKQAIPPPLQVLSFPPPNIPSGRADPPSRPVTSHRRPPPLHGSLTPLLMWLWRHAGFTNLGSHAESRGQLQAPLEANHLKATLEKEKSRMKSDRASLSVHEHCRGNSESLFVTAGQ